MTGVSSAVLPIKPNYQAVFKDYRLVILFFSVFYETEYKIM